MLAARGGRSLGQSITTYVVLLGVASAMSALIMEPTGRALTQPLLLGGVLMTWFANELRDAPPPARRRLLQAGFISGAYHRARRRAHAATYAPPRAHLAWPPRSAGTLRPAERYEGRVRVALSLAPKPQLAHSVACSRDRCALS